MATFKLYGNLEPLIEGAQPVELDAPTVRAAIDELVEQHPSLVGELVHADGEYNRYYSLLVNGEMMDFLDDLDTTLAENDEVTIFPPTAA
ncbi:MAG: MoaD/ThiS family protein [Dehalococcoidia bacterium]